MTALAAPRGWQGGWAQGLSYGGLGLPLAFVALPLYVILPNHYASEFGIPLATLGALLLFARLLDAVADPWIGRLVDGWFAHSVARVLGVALIAALVLAAGFRGLFFPAVEGTTALLAWCAALLAVTYLSYSVLSVIHQAWGARLGGGEDQRARIVSHANSGSCAVTMTSIPAAPSNSARCFRTTAESSTSATVIGPVAAFGGSRKGGRAGGRGGRRGGWWGGGWVQSLMARVSLSAGRRPFRSRASCRCCRRRCRSRPCAARPPRHRCLPARSRSGRSASSPVRCCVRRH